MSTADATVVNGQTTEGLWITVSELARLKNVDKSLVSRRIARFEAEGLVETRAGPRGAKLVQLAAYDRLCDDSVDAIRSTAQVPTAQSGDPVLAREQARRVAYQADLAKLDLEERLGVLIPVADVRAAFATFAEIFLSSVEQLPTRADEVAAAVAKDGVHGARSALKVVLADLRKAIARAAAEAAEPIARPAAAA